MLSRYFKPEHLKFHAISMATLFLLALSSIGFGIAQKQEKVGAATPAFFLQTGNTYTVGMPTTALIRADGTGEGTGLLGVETHITYDSTKLQVNSINFGTCIFDSCVDLSEVGTIKIIGASGPGGLVLNNQKTLATVNITPIVSGAMNYTFTKSDVITSSQTVESRVSTNKSVTIQTASGAVCGNSTVETGEQCDDGNVTNGDACTNACQNAVCGDSIVRIGLETCDDGNLTAGDGCSAVCQNETLPPTPAVCGNSTVETGEQCDDGNLVAGDGCSAACQNEVGVTLTGINLSTGAITKGTGNVGAGLQVGDWIQLISFAQYSDSSTQNVTSPSTNPGTSYQVISGSGSMNGSRFYPSSAGSSTLRVTYTEAPITVQDTVTVSTSNASPTAVCGNSMTEGSETCDDGNTVTESCSYGQTSCTVCNSSCQTVSGTTAFCSDSVVQTGNGEQCDDGNTSAGDGCSATCQNEVVLPIPVPSPVCGNGLVETGEQCDDGNSFLGDGCSASCALETPLLPVAPTLPPITPVETLEAAQTVLDQQNIETPFENPVLIQTPQEAASKLETCRANPEFTKANFNDSSVDTDGDGLSDRMECYAGTHPLKPDTDGDLCTDGDEVLFLYKNPLNGTDCSLKIENLKKSDLVQIIDPQPGWILASVTPRIMGLVPVDAESVGLVASEVTQAGATPLVVGQVKAFSDIEIAGLKAKTFETKSTELKEGATYDLIAVAKLKDGRIITSGAVRFTIDPSITIQKPIPESIGNIPISIDRITTEGPNGNEIEIKETKPRVTGLSDFGSQVFAVWNSLVLASSVISDSQEGTFVVQAPKNMEMDAGHKVTLYAVKSEAGKTIRSDSVNVYFHIKGLPFSIQTIVWYVLGALTLILITLAIRKMIQRAKTRQEALKIAKAAQKAYEEHRFRHSAPELTTETSQKTDESIEALADSIQDAETEKFDEDMRHMSKR